MTPAQRNRQEAIGMLSELYLPTDAEETRPFYLVNAYAGKYATAGEIADNIAKLTQCGRTARWQAAVKQWAGMVRAADNLRDIRWAFLQGLVYTTHASE